MSGERKRHLAHLARGLYGFTGEPFARGRTAVEIVEALLAGGARVIQYREKQKIPRQCLADCLRIRERTRAKGATFIVNDRPDIALLCDADGVHLGQDDLPVRDVRRLVGPRMLIGASTHHPEQLARAAAEGADYVGVGPLFATQTKAGVGPPVGLAYLDDAVKNSPLPFVAIGGIKRSHIPELLHHGARAIAMVTEILDVEDIAGRVREILHLLDR